VVHEDERPNARLGFFQIGGGIAGDFQSAWCRCCIRIAPHQRATVGYFCRSVIRRPATVRIGRSANEKITLGKLGATTPKYIVESDATIVAPLMFAKILGW